MTLSYRQIAPALARATRLLMTDVDGTLTTPDDSISPEAEVAVRQLEDAGISVGLASGRTLPGLRLLARRLGISGPIIAENGGVAALTPGDPPVGLGYSRQPALEALHRLMALYPGSIREREDNAERLVDVVFFADGLSNAELQQHLGDIQLLDSGYILHLMQPGISKGTTLMRLFREASLGVSPEQTMVVGDSATDLSLFQLFPHSVLIPNPRVPREHTQALVEAARYVSDLPFGEGFAQVARHIVAACAA